MLPVSVFRPFSRSLGHEIANPLFLPTMQQLFALFLSSQKESRSKYRNTSQCHFYPSR
jgi:hypothetical protein